MIRTVVLFSLWCSLTCLMQEQDAQRPHYDPLHMGSVKVEHKDITLHDAKRSRDIPLRVFLPGTSGPAPVILFSHGLGGSREGNSFSSRHWAARGYLVINLQHPGSDESVWRDQPLAQRMAAMQKAANGENLLLRVADVKSVLDQLEHWQVDKKHFLYGRIDLQNIGLSGHSFGAATTQAVSGQRFPIGPSMTDGRIKAAVIMSPSSARQGSDQKAAFGQVKMPWLLLTGTNDGGIIGGQTPQTRLLVFPALPEGDKYQLVLHKAEHSAFNDRGLPFEREKRNPNHHQSILAISTAFWDAYLRHSEVAKAWLQSDAVRNVLEKDDQWQRK